MKKFTIYLMSISFFFILGAGLVYADDVYLSYSQVADSWSGSDSDGSIDTELTTDISPANVSEFDSISTYMHFDNNSSGVWAYHYTTAIDPDILSFDNTYQGPNCSGDHRTIVDQNVRLLDNGMHQYEFGVGEVHEYDGIDSGECGDAYVDWLYKGNSNSPYVWKHTDVPGEPDYNFSAGYRTDTDKIRGSNHFHSDESVKIWEE